jgi:hypothetical protein
LLGSVAGLNFNTATRRLGAGNAAGPGVYTAKYTIYNSGRVASTPIIIDVYDAVPVATIGSYTPIVFTVNKMNPNQIFNLTDYFTDTSGPLNYRFTGLPEWLRHYPDNNTLVGLP